MALPRKGLLRLLVGKQLQKPLSSRFVIVGLGAQESAKDRDILLANELFQGYLLRADAYFEIRDMPRSQPRTTADFIGSSTELQTGSARTAQGQSAQRGKS
jgi:hypothetical protein